MLTGTLECQMLKQLAPETIAAHSLHAIDERTGAIAPPLHMATSYARDEDYLLKVPQSYLRYGNSTVTHAEQLLAALDGGPDAAVFSSGMSAVVTLLDTVPHGAHVVAPCVMYYGTRDWLQRLERLGRIELTLFDQADPAALAHAVRPGVTNLVWIETPANPTWDVIDIGAAADIAHSAGAILVVDGTCSSPAVTRPLEHGADYVFHSVTKYLNGHSDVLGGALIPRIDNERWQEVRTLRNMTGCILSPFDCWLLIRGMRTLFVRVRAASASAMRIAHHFENHPQIEQVLYPGLESHPGHHIAQRQMDGYGAMMSICVRGGLREAGRVVRALRVFLPATSLGGVESLAEHRIIVEGPTSAVPDNLIRLSIGIEAVADLIADLKQALAQA